MIDPTYSELKQLLLSSEKLWKNRFERAAEIVREYGHDKLADMILGMKNTTFKVSGPSKFQVSRTPREERLDNIVATIKKLKQCSTIEIANELNCSRRVINDYLPFLVMNNRVVKHDKGPMTYYSLPTELKAVG